VLPGLYPEAGAVKDDEVEGTAACWTTGSLDGVDGAAATVAAGPGTSPVGIVNPPADEGADEGADGAAVDAAAIGGIANPGAVLIGAGGSLLMAVDGAEDGVGDWVELVPGNG
jgi:hypothetical protein